MSSAPRRGPHRGSAGPITLPGLLAKKAAAEPIVMITAYDYPSAVIASRAGVDLVLVGDSAAMTMLGLSSTTPVSVDEMLVLMRAVRRGLDGPLLVGDLPFGSYQISDEQAVENAVLLVKDGGCDAVKLEGGGPVGASRAAAIVAAGIPVMGHVGLTPQTATALGGYRAQGRDLERARDIIDQATALQQAGCFALVLEAIPAKLSELLTPRLADTVVIGIGAGPATDGQVLVWHDLLGIGDDHEPARFVRRYADLQQTMITAVSDYTRDVRERRYPQPEHSYLMPAETLRALTSGETDRLK